MDKYDIEKIKDYITAIWALAEKSNNEYTSAIVRLCMNIEELTFNWGLE